MDRVTEETYKIHATLPELVIEDENPNSNDASSSSTFSPLMVVGILSLVVLSVLLTSLSTVAIMRRKKNAIEESRYITQAPIELTDNVKFPKSLSKLPPPPPMMPKLPKNGLPDGWSMEQWHHYGEEYIRRQK